MENSFLTHLLQILSPEDWSALHKFVRSPFFNQKPELIRLLDILDKQQDALDHLDKVKLFHRVAPGEKVYRNLRMNRMMSDLAALIRTYLAWSEWQSADMGMAPRLNLLRALRKRDARATFEREWRKLEDSHQKLSYRHAAWQRLGYELHTEKFAFEAIHSRERFTGTGALLAYLGQFFLLETLKWSCMVASLRTLRGSGDEALFMEQTLDHAEQLAPEDYPAAALLRQSLRVLDSHATETDFQRMKELLQRFAGVFPATESRDVYMAAINFCIRKHNQGDATFTAEAFRLYRDALEAGVLFDNGVLAIYAYTNIHALAQRLGEREWALAFLEKYRFYLPPNDQENIYRYNLAIHHFKGGRYEEVLQLLQEVIFPEIFYQLDARRMMLRAYYERREWLALASLLDSFTTFLRRREDLGYHRVSYLNLIRFTKKLARTGGQPAKTKARDLALKIQGEQFVADREWLLQQLGIAASVLTNPS